MLFDLSNHLVALHDTQQTITIAVLRRGVGIPVATPPPGLDVDILPTGHVKFTAAGEVGIERIYGFVGYCNIDPWCWIQLRHYDEGYPQQAAIATFEKSHVEFLSGRLDDGSGYIAAQVAKFAHLEVVFTSVLRGEASRRNKTSA